MKKKHLTFRSSIVLNEMFLLSCLVLMTVLHFILSKVHLPIKRSVRPRLVKPADGSNMGITSNTAKRILDTLEKMSTPLSDAKRIPLSPSSTPLAFTVRFLLLYSVYSVHFEGTGRVW